MTLISRRNGSPLSFLAALLCLCLQFATPLQAQIADRPKAGPEQQKLAVWLGEWDYEGTIMDSRLGPGGKFKGTEQVRWTMDGLFQESRSKDKGVYGGKPMTYEGLLVRWYNAVSKTFLSRSFDNDGVIGEGVDTVSGNTWTSTGSGVTSKGEKTLSRGTTVFSADGKSRTGKFEISFDDGKTWAPLWELTAKRR